jgi:hypothetical protein
VVVSRDSSVGIVTHSQQSGGRHLGPTEPPIQRVPGVKRLRREANHSTPSRTYGIQLWGTASTSNLEILEHFQSKALRMIVDAPW